MPWTKSNYAGKTAIITTKHEKDKVIRSLFLAKLALSLKVSQDIDTDSLGTFSGEIARKGTPLETAIKKARLGMEQSGINIGLANEGSFGPHPNLPLISASEEIMVFLDDNIGITVAEKLFSTQTNFNYIHCSSIDELNDFLAQAKFPSHALVVRQPDENGNILHLLKLNVLKNKPTIFKGIQDREQLAAAIESILKLSPSKRVLIETDMRAHMNPTRQEVIKALAAKLIRRLKTLCPQCHCPGFGCTDIIAGLPCQLCMLPSQYPKAEILACPKCNHKEQAPLQPPKLFLEPAYCLNCNP